MATISDEHVIELIKAICLHKKALDTWMDTFSKQTAILGKKLSIRSKDQLRSLLTSNQFLQPFVAKIKNRLTDADISRLLQVYQSDAMQKLLEYSQDLFDPLYRAMGKKAEEAASKS